MGTFLPRLNPLADGIRRCCCTGDIISSTSTLVPSSPTSNPNISGSPKLSDIDEHQISLKNIYQKIGNEKAGYVYCISIIIVSQMR